MRLTNRRLTGILWTVVAAGFASLLLDGCSEPKTTARSGGSAQATVPQTPFVPSSLPPGGGNVVVEGTTGPTLPDLPPADPAEVRAAWGEGVRLFEAKDFAGAAERLEVAVSGRQDDPYAHFLLGLSLFKSGQAERAEQSLSESARLGPGSLKTWVNLARVRLERHEAAGALEAADTALAIDGGHADALHQKGRALAALGRKVEALETLRVAHDADPTNGQIANTLGFWLIQSGRPGDAIALLEVAREQLPQTAYVRNNLGVAYERTGRIDEALAEYRAAVSCGDSGGRAAASLARLNAPESDPVMAEANPSPDSH